MLLLFTFADIFPGDLSIKTLRARRVGVADLYKAWNDWSTVKECRPIQFGEMSATKMLMSAAFFGKYEEAVKGI